MRSFAIPATEEATKYLDLIVTTMMQLFNVSDAEAVGRINRFWSGYPLHSEGSVNALLHEMPDFWAKTIYYGRHVKWWLGEEGLSPEPYPNE
jgi:hypothetical protein